MGKLISLLDIRRKILVGAWVLESKDHEEALRKELDTYLVRDSDRKLFGLPPKKTEG